MDGVVGVVNATTPDWQHARHFLTGEAASHFIPNSRRDAWLAGLDLRTQSMHQIREARQRDIRGHVLPRAQGLDAPGRDDLWLFQGRHEALRTARRWLLDDGPATLVVTGDPGSGKSSLLARLHVLSSPELHRRVPAVHTLPEDTMPPDGCITRFVHARGMTAQDLMTALGEAVGRVEDTTSPGRLLAELGEGPPVVVVVDAVDEAIGRRNRMAHGAVPGRRHRPGPVGLGRAPDPASTDDRHPGDPFSLSWARRSRTHLRSGPWSWTWTTSCTPTGTASAATSSPA